MIYSMDLFIVSFVDVDVDVDVVVVVVADVVKWHWYPQVLGRYEEKVVE
ncbi:MAG: hypothetical protein ACI90V_009206 [Bacillariaceae sp.]|jgi:hypothetical protein